MRTSTQIAVVLLLALAGEARASSWPPVSSELPPTGLGANDAAVVIGISEYAFLPKIPGAGDNATDWFRFLVKSRGVPQDRVRLLCDIDATSETITEAVQDTAKNVGP